MPGGPITIGANAAEPKVTVNGCDLDRADRSIAPHGGNSGNSVIGSDRSARVQKLSGGGGLPASLWVDLITSPTSGDTGSGGGRPRSQVHKGLKSTPVSSSCCSHMGPPSVVIPSHA